MMLWPATICLFRIRTMFMNNSCKYPTPHNIWRRIFILLMVSPLVSCSLTTHTSIKNEVGENICRYCNGIGQTYFCPKCGKSLDLLSHKQGKSGSKRLCSLCNGNPMLATRPCQYCNGSCLSN